MTKKMNAAGGYDFSASELKNIAAATTGTSAAQWAQVQDLVTAQMSNLDYKGSVRVASTANVSITSAPSTLDGVTLSSGNRILLKNQVLGAENGIYTFAAASSPLIRATDANADSEVTAGMWVTVEDGTANQDTAWWLTTNNPIVVGTTALVFSAFPPPAMASLSKYTTTGPSSTGTTWTVSHSLGTKAVAVSVWEVSTDEEIDVHKVATDTNTITLTSAASMSSNAYRVVVIG
ncbi:hypothetical protein AB0G15_05980 [Streptosporangium sp. NPDC023825]|uniref:hypothetical protein n=1 Tax=Streptosporangium sp. NPDC023825 TaxID=3154909 RepID=UPI003419A2FC